MINRLIKFSQVKRVRDRKTLTQSSKQRLLKHAHKSTKSGPDQRNEILQVKTYTELSDSCSSSTTSSSSSCSTPTKRTEAVTAKQSCVMIWLLITILGMMFIWGRFFAILCTTICLYCLRRRGGFENRKLRRRQREEYNNKKGC